MCLVSVVGWCWCLLTMVVVVDGGELYMCIDPVLFCHGVPCYNISRCFYIVNSIWFHPPLYNVYARQIRLYVPVRFTTLVHATIFFVVYGSHVVSHLSPTRSVAIVHFLAPVNSRLVFGFGVGSGSVTLSHARSQQATAIYATSCPTLAAKLIIDIVVAAAAVYMCVCVNAYRDDARCSNR